MYRFGRNTPGYYELNLDGNRTYRNTNRAAFCRDGWTTILYRSEHSGEGEDFFPNRSLQEYIDGFTSAGDDEWMGLDFVSKYVIIQRLLFSSFHSN